MSVFIHKQSWPHSVCWGSLQCYITIPNVITLVWRIIPAWLRSQQGTESTAGGRPEAALLTDGIPQGKVIALGGKYWVKSSLAVAALGTGNQQRERAHGDEHGRFGDEDAPQEGPDDVTEVQQHHVLEQQRRQSELWHEVAQSFGLRGRDDVRPPGDVAA